MRASILALLLLFAPPALAEEGNDSAPTAAAAPARMFGHLPYAEADRAVLVPVPSLGGCMMAREAVDDVEAMLAAARGEGIELGAVSCFRSVEHQRRIFCEGAADCGSVAALRSRFVGPPGHSEHATGYAIDFVQRGSDCRAVEQCFALTAAGQWLMRRGPEFGFEMSFPAGNRQGVGWEPWHWRWVGRSDDGRTAVQAARARVAAARTQFPALPAVAPAKPVATKVWEARWSPAPLTARLLGSRMAP
jgi:D-alanyl-D-alanine carboxypeptidase